MKMMNLKSLKHKVSDIEKESPRAQILTLFHLLHSDWEDSKTSLAHLNSEGGATGLSMSGEQGGTGDHLWEDNWDDDDVEDDFGKALRAELEKQSGKAGQPMAT